MARSITFAAIGLLYGCLLSALGMGATNGGDGTMLPLAFSLVDYRAIPLILLRAYFTTSVVFAVARGDAIRIAKASAQALIHLIPALFTAGD